MKHRAFSSDGLNLLRACVAIGFAIAPVVVRESRWFQDALARAVGPESDLILDLEILMFALFGFLAGVLCRGWSWTLPAAAYVGLALWSHGMILIAVLHVGAYLATAFAGSTVMKARLHTRDIASRAGREV